MAIHVRWYGQAAFRLEAGGKAVFVDPFGPVGAAASRGLRFDYPPIRDVHADLVLVTHEHFDHNAVSAVAGSPQVIRSTAGSFDTPAGRVLAVAAEHDDAAGTVRGPDSIFVFTLDGLRCCHFGDFGQRELREAQAAAIGRPDLLFIPVGGGPTIDGLKAAEIARHLDARWVVPMHYRTPAVNFLETADAFLATWPEERVRRLDGPEFDTADLPDTVSEPLVVVPAWPGAN